MRTPSDAVTLYPWEDRDGEPVRVYHGTETVITTPTGTITAYVEGVQTMREVVRTIVVIGDGDLTCDQAREFVARLGAMLPEVDGVDQQ